MLGTALALPPDERAWLTSELIASLDEGEDADVEAAWAAEIERRQTKGCHTSSYRAIVESLFDRSNRLTALPSDVRKGYAFPRNLN